MKELIFVCINILSWLIGYGAITYWSDNKDFNKGVCPKCGKPMELRRKDGLFYVYWCSSSECMHATLVSNPYLNWRYGRKLKRRMVVVDFLKATYEPIKGWKDLLETRPRIKCKDGYTVSLQAGRTWYCLPKENLKDGNYIAVELGCPNEPDILINHYAEDKTDYKNTIYPYVPVATVEKLIEKHGGVKSYLGEKK